MSPVLVGSNPGLVWRDAEEKPTAAISIWDVEWSIRGSGRCLLYWPGEGEVHAFATSRELSDFLWEEFTCHFPEFRWPGPRVVHFHACDVALVLRPDRVIATAAGSDAELHVEMYGEASNPRPVRVVDFPLGDRRLELRNVLFPVTDHRLRTSLPAPSSGADSDGFIALAEVWLRPSG